VKVSTTRPRVLARGRCIGAGTRSLILENSAANQIRLAWKISGDSNRLGEGDDERHLWILQVLLGCLVFHSFLLLRTFRERAQGGMRYILEMPAGLRVFAGVAEGLQAWRYCSPPLIHRSGGRAAGEFRYLHWPNTAASFSLPPRPSILG